MSLPLRRVDDFLGDFDNQHRRYLTQVGETVARPTNLALGVRGAMSQLLESAEFLTGG